MDGASSSWPFQRAHIPWPVKLIKPTSVHLNTITGIYYRVMYAALMKMRRVEDIWQKRPLLEITELFDEFFNNSKFQLF